VLSAGSLIASGYYLEEARTTQDATRTTAWLLRSESESREEEREIRDDLVYYEQMRQRGVVGEQSRLDWIESIARIKNDRKLFEIRYNFDAQRPLDYPGLIPTSAADFVVSKVETRHAAAARRGSTEFLADLQAGIKAHVSVRSCVVSRVERRRGTGCDGRCNHAFEPSARST